MTLSAQIRDLIVSYSAGTMDVSKFRDEFLPLFASTNGSDKDASDLAFNVESVYAEYIEELIEEKDLRVRLSHLVPSKEENVFILGFKETTRNESPEVATYLSTSSRESIAVS